MEEGPPPPADPELRRNAESLAQFVAKNGPHFEQVTRANHGGNPAFSFLFGGEGAAYYEHLKQAAAAGGPAGGMPPGPPPMGMPPGPPPGGPPGPPPFGGPGGLPPPLGGAPPLGPPPGAEVCNDFLRGTCFRPSCKFSHAIPPGGLPPPGGGGGGMGAPPGASVCNDFLRGRCFRVQCKFSHVAPPPGTGPPPGGPPPMMMGGAVGDVCNDFQNGRCFRGAQCRYAHIARDAGPPPAAAAPPPQVPQDWDCPECGNTNFARRNECFRCGKPKPGGMSERWDGRAGASGIPSMTEYRMSARAAQAIADQLNRDRRRALRGTSKSSSSSSSSSDSDSDSRSPSPPPRRGPPPRGRDSPPPRGPRSRSRSPRRR